MIVENKLAFNQYLKLSYSLTYRRISIILITITGLFLLIRCIPFVDRDLWQEGPPYFDLFFGLFAVIILPVMTYSAAKKTFSSNGLLQERMTFEFTEDRIKISGETFNSEYGWEKIYKIRELNSWILIYQSKRSANMIPTAAFGDKLNEFRNLVKRKPLIKQDLKKSNPF